MAGLRIDADALFRAVTSHDFQLLAYYLDLRSGEVSTRTLSPDDVKEPPPGPSVKPLPVLGGDLTKSKGDAPFGPVEGEKKKDLFGDEPTERKDPFGGSFWQRDTDRKSSPFGEFKREQGSKKLAEIFEDAPKSTENKDPFTPKDEAMKAPFDEGSAKPANPDPFEKAVPPEVDADEPLQRIPPATEEQNLEWHQVFARECGDPEIREVLEKALNAKKPFSAFQRTIRKYQRMNQQWDNYYRKQALFYASEWLKGLPIQWEIVDSSAPGGGV